MMLQSGEKVDSFSPPPDSQLVSLLGKRGRHHDAGTKRRAMRAARSLAYVRKGGPLLMRACRCVSERRSRASTEVIGQYQSQPRDNHSPAMRPAEACMSACMHACMRACPHIRARTCVIVAKLIISRSALVAVGRIPSNLAIFKGEGDQRNRVCILHTICRRYRILCRRKREREDSFRALFQEVQSFHRLNRGFD